MEVVMTHSPSRALWQEFVMESGGETRAVVPFE
jgi:hypothetical protein